MDATQAQTFIELRLQPGIDPELSNDEVLALVDLAVTTDVDGIDPTEDGWTPTYSIRGCWYAVAEGYLIKYGKAVGRFSFTTDGQTFTRNQTLDHLEHQRKRALGKVQSCPSTLPDMSTLVP